MVRYEYDPENPPPLTEERIERVERVKAMGDEGIDLSDIPESDLSRAFRHQEWRLARQSQGLVVLEGDLRRWLASLGDDRHRQVNDILRRVMLEHQASESKAAA